jgi:hypothetical protein
MKPEPGRGSGFSLRRLRGPIGSKSMSEVPQGAGFHLGSAGYRATSALSSRASALADQDREPSPPAAGRIVPSGRSGPFARS